MSFFWPPWFSAVPIPNTFLDVSTNTFFHQNLDLIQSNDDSSKIRLNDLSISLTALECRELLQHIKGLQVTPIEMPQIMLNIGDLKSIGIDRLPEEMFLTFKTNGRVAAEMVSEYSCDDFRGAYTLNRGQFLLPDEWSPSHPDIVRVDYLYRWEQKRRSEARDLWANVGGDWLP